MTVLEKSFAIFVGVLGILYILIFVVAFFIALYSMARIIIRSRSEPVGNDDKNMTWFKKRMYQQSKLMTELFSEKYKEDYNRLNIAAIICTSWFMTLGIFALVFKILKKYYS